jgi:HK97 family phage portal protein
MVTPKVRKDGVKEFHVHGKDFNKVFSNNDIFHVHGLSLDGVKGINPIKYASQTLGLGLSAEKMQSSAFGKGLHAGGVIEMPEEYKGMLGSTDEESTEFMGAVRESFRKLYQNGPDSWHEMMFLEPGWKFDQFKLNLETAQIIETRKMGVADIARLLGVPLHKLMQLDKATNNNIEQQGIEYVQDGVLPITLNIEAEADAKLLKSTEQNDYFYKYNLDGLMRGTLKDRFEAYSTALGKNAPGFMSPSEIRDLEDLGPADEDELFKPDNMNKQSFQENG